MFDTTENTPKEEIRRRIAAFQTGLEQQDVDGALIVQATDLFYFSGTIQQGHLYVPAVGGPLLMARKSFERACAESPLNQIVPLTSPRKIPTLIGDHGHSMPLRLGMELDVLPANLFFMYRRIFPDVDIVDISHTIRQLRAVKSDYEVAQMTRSAGFADQVAEHVAEILKEGMTEIELAGRAEAHARKLGHQGIIRMRSWGSEMFYGHLLAGPSGAVPGALASPTAGTATNPAVAQGAGFTVIRRNQPVLLDYVFAQNGYLADHSRIFSIGSLPDHLAAAHRAMLGIQGRVMQAAVPGIRVGELYDLALALADDAGYADHFMGVGPQRIKFIGHGLGLELDEYPILAKGQDMILEEGMVIALEPKLIFPGTGVVGIENTHRVGPDGLQRLTRYPDDVTVVSC